MQDCELARRLIFTWAKIRARTLNPVNELDLDPTSEYTLKEARIVELEEAIHAANDIRWFHHVGSRPAPAISDWSAYRIVPQGFDEMTGYEIGYTGLMPYMPDKLTVSKPSDNNSMNVIFFMGKKKRNAVKPRRNKKSPKQRKFNFI